MTPDQIDLARALVAHPRWRWMPGMLWSIGPQPGWVRARAGEDHETEAAALVAALEAAP